MASFIKVHYINDIKLETPLFFRADRILGFGGYHSGSWVRFIDDDTDLKLLETLPVLQAAIAEALGLP